jgi:hypothetical protein
MGFLRFFGKQKSNLVKVARMGWPVYHAAVQPRFS